MNTLVMLVLAYGAGIVTAIAFFAWSNRKSPDAVDKAEDVIRKF